MPAERVRRIGPCCHKRKEKAYPRQGKNSTTHTRTTRPAVPGATSARTTANLAPDVGYSTDACQKGQTHRAVLERRNKKGRPCAKEALIRTVRLILSSSRQERRIVPVAALGGAPASSPAGVPRPQAQCEQHQKRKLFDRKGS
eukprot:6475063-Pyramimonas_sp.AAC.1